MTRPRRRPSPDPVRCPTSGRLLDLEHPVQMSGRGVARARCPACSRRLVVEGGSWPEHATRAPWLAGGDARRA